MDDRCSSALRRSSGADYPRNLCRASGRVSNDLSVLMPFGQRRETARRHRPAQPQGWRWNLGDTTRGDAHQLHHKADLKTALYPSISKLASASHVTGRVMEHCTNKRLQHPSVALIGESPCDLPDLEALGTAGDRERPTQLTPARVRLRTPGVASFLPVLLQS
ncbi:unnamed protein product [Gadus morhua 'NCC']